MDKRFVLATGCALALSLALAFPSAAQEKEKKKAEKDRGDVGLLDLERNYMILVTKEGKLITLDFGDNAKVTMLEAKEATMGDMGLGSSAEVEYQTKDDKATITKMEFRPAKGGE